jgi:dihydroorotase
LAATGIIGLETMLPLALELYHNGALGLSDLLAKMTSRPAELLGLRGGKLVAGAPADLLIFDPDKPWRIDEDGFHSKANNTPYHGRPVQGRPWRTIVDGKVVYSEPDGD